jgi:hypothetical protein
MQFKNRTFRNERVELDGNEFHGCDIQHCTLVYQGGGGPLLDSCTIAHNQFVFEESAGNTINFLRDFYHGGFQDAIQPVIDHILNNVRP